MKHFYSRTDSTTAEPDEQIKVFSHGFRPHTGKVIVCTTIIITILDDITNRTITFDANNCVFYKSIGTHEQLIEHFDKAICI